MAANRAAAAAGLCLSACANRVAVEYARSFSPFIVGLGFV